MTQPIVMPALEPNNAFEGPVATLGPAKGYVPVVIGQNYAFYGRWIYCGGGSGTIDYMKWDGTVVTGLPIFAGSQFFMCSLQIVAATATLLFVSD